MRMWYVYSDLHYYILVNILCTAEPGYSYQTHKAFPTRCIIKQSFEVS